MDKKITYLAEDSGGTGDKLKKLKKKLTQCQKEKEEYLTQAQRARADLINYQRRQEQALEELKKYGQGNFVRELLPVLDSLRIGAEQNEGVKQIKEQLETILKNHGLKQIKTKGEKFNPELHEAVEQMKSKEKEGMIVEEIQKGYLLNDKVLRASKVKIAK